MSDKQDLRCPVCGDGVVADIAFDRDPSASGDLPSQSADSTELTTYSCGHQVPGRSLASADAEVLDVERRDSAETVTPTTAP
jgi:hypothetical protein